MRSTLLCNWSQLKRQEWSWETCIENGLQELQAFIVCYDTKQILLKRQQHHWILPGRLYHLSEFASAFEPFKVIPDIHEIIGSTFPLSFLRQAWRRAKQADAGDLRYFNEKSVVLMACTREDASESNASVQERGYQWISVHEAHVFHVEEEASLVIQEELNWVLKEAQPENRLSWQRPGWLTSTSSWMIEQLRSKRDATLTAEIIQLRSSHLGTILQAETTRGRFFLKSTPSLANDAAYTETLARISPMFVETPIALDTEKQIMITADYGEILGPDTFSDIEIDRLTKDYARLQMATIGKEEELMACGMPDLRLPKLLEHIDRLAACPIFKSLGNCERAKADVDFFCENTECFKAELIKLDAMKLPAVVLHNDLFSSNIYKPEGRENYMFFDFAEAYVSHPFVLWLWSLDEKCYLQEWSSRAHAEMDELPKLLYTGGTCYLLALMVLRLKEAEVAEFPESEEHLASVRSSLLKFNRCFGANVE